MAGVEDVEQKFLAAIAASPNDREARSVYADWLDERGDPRGEYLRLELQLTEIPARMAALAPHIEESWIGAIARVCDVVLLDAGPNKISTIKAVREVSGLGLRDSKDLVDLATHAHPRRIRERISVDEARDVAKRVAEYGALVRILAHDGTVSPRPPPPEYVTTSNPPFPSLSVVILAVPRDARIATIKAVRELTGFGLKEAKDLVDRVEAGPQVLFADLDDRRARDVANRLRTSCSVEVRSS